MPIILTTRHITGLWGNDGFGRPIAMESRTLSLLGIRQAKFLEQNPAASGPQDITSPVDAYIGNGCWRIKCRCGERTHTDPEWKVAYCFGCGARWLLVGFPENREAIERLLCLRPVQATRNWYPDETIEMLTQEQIAHGDPIQ